ncbi:MAG: EF-P lysine aminoacylase GenX [Nitrospirae bacterium CG18_big_fil_WC_8_21_14_2_50_70_55]|nr:EF-P lysine aminoacylase GenX [Deltaproteobacteria bacterium]PIQ06769.1 MAG: EF-P lysine aminoacylase GenX [Nitrospirae bacterium CG18_big_fil_WC_8_21_14_2_50_70_55]PIU80018.1 MAG: EF-P lysine aminoacylase GenX [Nitrospirae bacterium CG06_land_8_20_14_3_00_70_43]PIW83264.1 MAG: EF-P lysine aminoacylase GenX [Nitrospirae bacterium CG_4_8_14_3_um_filter_70_85]PIX82577.1 MAG: EF-P lysine aminoacylase GenX [Nitrospirae bacterium CG_4_10_14_3_um_filter_70_108]PJB94893.1 MAG: EF-P lysine aminoacy
MNGSRSGLDSPFSRDDRPRPTDSAGDAAAADLVARRPYLEARAATLAVLRRFFAEGGFLEVETPRLVVCPGLEPHLDAFAVATTPRRYLPTSPELHLKRLVAAGYERIFELGRCFRAEEAGTLHLAEPTLVEWYRSGASLTDLMGDCEQLLRRVAAAVAPVGGAPARPPLAALDLVPPFTRLTYRDGCRAFAGVDPADFPEVGGVACLRAVLADLGLHTAADDDRDTLLERLWIDRVEPHLGQTRPCFVTDFPASQAALAAVRPDPVWPVAQRFELYVGGVELANAFFELTDASEQRRRFTAWQTQRGWSGREVYPVDEQFLAALAHGLPACAGIALGVDRLVMLATGGPDVASVVCFGGTE